MRLVTLTAALLAAGLAAPALAAPDAALLEKLVARLDKLEARNAELEREVKSLKAENEKVAQGLDSDRISQYEPEITARLKAVEKDALDMKKAAKKIDALDGLKVGAALTTVAQTYRSEPKGSRFSRSALNYRADVTAELPLEPIGDVDQKLFAHFRMGQGEGLNHPLGNFGQFSAPNAVAFRASGLEPDTSVAVLGEAWYQAAIPLPFGGFKPHSRETLELSFGKMDFFGFFDQNAEAGDESSQYLNSLFVHNPLLDAGGEASFDANGFQPGFVASYVNSTDKSRPWRLSLGIFGAGDHGANYQHSLSSPLVIAQAEKQLRLFGGLAGHYRAYVWSRAKSLKLDGETPERHTGFGFSADQKVGDGVGLWGRYGKQVKGQLPFDQGLSLGANFHGGYWGRGGDTLGIARSWLKASREYKRAVAEGDITRCFAVDDDGLCTDDRSFSAQGAEKVAEIYYRYRLSPQFALTPDFQWISRPGANPDARSVKILGLRANLAF